MISAPNKIAQSLSCKHNKMMKFRIIMCMCHLLIEPPSCVSGVIRTRCQQASHCAGIIEQSQHTQASETHHTPPPFPGWSTMHISCWRTEGNICSTMPFSKDHFSVLGNQTEVDEHLLCRNNTKHTGRDSREEDKIISPKPNEKTRTTAHTIPFSTIPFPPPTRGKWQHHRAK